MSRWFRVYDDLVDDPKVQRLPAELFRALVNIWCLASKGGGVLPSIDEIAFKLRVKADKAYAIVASLRNAGLIEDDEDGTHPHNWDSRQFKSDVSNERVKRHRERKCNVTDTVTETPPETETETEKEEKNNLTVVPKETVMAFDAYNEMAERLGLSKATKLSPQRQSKLRARLRDAGGIAGWGAALARVAASAYCRGEVNGFKADLGFLLQDESFTRLMEGKYDDRKSVAPLPGVHKPGSITELNRTVRSALAGKLAENEREIAEAERRLGIGGENPQPLSRLQQGQA